MLFGNIADMVNLDTKSLELWANRCLTWACLPAVLAISYLMAQLTWFAVSPEQFLATIKQASLQLDSGDHGDVQGAAPSTLQAHKAAHALPKVNINTMRDWHLFGQYQKVWVATPKANVPIPTKAPKTKLNLELIGVFVAESESNSSAIISEKGRESKLYRVGDTVPGNATLSSVFSDRVVIDRQGRFEALYFAKADTDSAAMGISSERKPSNQPFISPNASPRRRSAQSSRNSLQPKQLLTSVRDHLAADQEGTLQELGLELMAGSAGNQVKITPKTPPEIRQLLGLRSGDILISVGGYPAGQLVQNASLIDELSQNNKVAVEIERNNRRFKVNVKVPKGLNL